MRVEIFVCIVIANALEFKTYMDLQAEVLKTIFIGTNWPDGICNVKCTSCIQNQGCDEVP